MKKSNILILIALFFPLTVFAAEKTDGGIPLGSLILIVAVGMMIWFFLTNKS